MRMMDKRLSRQPLGRKCGVFKMDINNKNKLNKSIKGMDNLQNRALLAFPINSTKTYILEVLSEIRSNWKEAEKQVRTPLLLIIILVIIFELFQLSAIQEVSLGPIKIADLSFVQKIIPIVIAFYFYSIANISLMISSYHSIHNVIMKRHFPKIVENDIEKFITPPYFSIFGDNSFLPRSYKFTHIIKNLLLLLGYLVIFGPVIFDIYAFLMLFYKFGVNDLFIWLVLLFSIYFVSIGLMIMPAINEM
jgi:hypothetical protein